MQPFVHQVRVRYAETDQMRVAHHGSYVTWLEEARTEWMRALGWSYATLEQGGIGLPVRQLSVRYRSAAVYEQLLEIRVWTARLRPVAVTIGYEVRDASDGQLLATAEVELACIDLSQRPFRPRALPEGLHEAFSRGRLD